MADSPYTPAAMDARRVELRAKRDAILAGANPIRDQRDQMVQEHERARAILDKQLADSEAGLADIQHELAFLDTAMGGHNMVASDADANR